MVTGYSKRFAALVTGFARKYQLDPFFRTEVTVVALQCLFALFLLAVVGVIATQLYHNASSAVIEGIGSALKPDSSPAAIGSSVVDQLDYTRSRTVVYAIVVILIVTATFTYIIARIALAPTRNALESQKQFIGNVAHELRTPLAVSKTNLEVALMTPVEKGLRQTLEGTIEELDRISEIINNLLSLSASIRPERIEFSDVDLGSVARSAIQKIKNFADSKHLELQVRMSERRVVWGNAVALEQIVMNILKNAFAHTQPGGRVLVTIEPVYPNFMELTVQDSGVGIGRKDLFRIFEPYYRGDPSRKRGDGGSGLGLTIVSELIKLHNGRISVRSAEGRGTTVVVLLPAGKVPLGIGEKSSRERGRSDTSEIAVDFSSNTRRN